MPKTVSWLTPGALVLCAGASLFAADPPSALLHPQTPPAAAPPAAAAPVIPDARPEDGAMRINVPDLRQMLDNKQAILIDVRDRASYAVEHAEGAISIPYAELAAHVSELPKDKLIVTYCT